MIFNPLTLLLTVIGGLIVAALIGWIRKPRLVVLVPRTFSYSQITERGQLVEVTVFNRSFKTEEAIDVTLNPALSYEMLGANSQDVSVVKNRIQITRVGPSDEVTVLLLIENGVFKPDDITQILSKETKGKTVSKLGEVPPTGSQRIWLVAWIIGFPLFLYAGILGLDYLLTKTSLLTSTTTNEPKSVEIRAWKVPSYAKTVSPQLFADFQAGKIAPSIGSLTRKSDIVSVPVRVQNDTTRVVKFTVSMTTTSSEKRIPSYERHVSDVMVLPGRAEERSIKVIIPEKASNPAEQIVFIELFLENTDGDSFRLKQDYVTK